MLHVKLTKIALGLFLVGYGFSLSLFLSVPENAGNGGAFHSMLAIATLCLAALVTTPVGVASTVLAVVNRNNSTRSLFHSIWFPFLLSSPPFVYLIWQYIIHGLL